MADTEDVAAVTELMTQYCDLIDCGDLAGCAALFEKGAWGIVGRSLKVRRRSVHNLITSPYMMEGRTPVI